MHIIVTSMLYLDSDESESECGQLECAVTQTAKKAIQHKIIILVSILVSPSSSV